MRLKSSLGHALFLLLGLIGGYLLWEAAFWWSVLMYEGALILGYWLYRSLLRSDQNILSIQEDDKKSREVLSTLLSSSEREGLFAHFNRKWRDLQWQAKVKNEYRSEDLAQRVLESLVSSPGLEVHEYLEEFGRACLVVMEKAGRAQFYACSLRPVTKDLRQGKGEVEKELFLFSPDGDNSRLRFLLRDLVQECPHQNSDLSACGRALHSEIRAQSHLEVAGQLWKLLLWQGYEVSQHPCAVDRDWLESFARSLSQGLFLQARVRSLDRELEHERQEKESSLMRQAEGIHDIRSPLSNLRAVLEYLQLGPSGKGQGHTQIDLLCQAALRDCDHISEVLGEFAQEASFEMNRTFQHEEEAFCRPAKLIVEELQSQELLAREKGLDFQIEVSPCCVPYELLVSRGEFNRILCGMVSNSVKYTQSGWIRCLLALSEDGLECICRDSGPGIAREKMEKLRERIQLGTWVSPQLAKNISAPSWGLGLAQLQEKSLQMQAEFQISSIEGVGTEFRFLFPQKLLRKLRGAQFAPFLGKGKDSGARLILIEDDPKFAQSFGRLLEISGHPALIYTGLAQCVEGCDLSSVEHVLIDQSVLHGAQYTVLEKLIEAHPNLRVAFMSGNDFLWRRQEARYARLGISHFFQKPCSVQKVLDWLHETADQGHQHTLQSQAVAMNN